MISSQAIKTSVIIAGGGMVGLTLGLALAKAGIETVVVDGLDPAVTRQAGFDGRVSSFASSSCKMLEALGLWERVKDVAQPIFDIIVGDGTVREGASAALLHFDHRETSGSPLAHMIENRHFRMALEQEAEGVAALLLMAPAQVSGIEVLPYRVIATLGDGRQVEAELCVAADGRLSPLREAMGIKSNGRDYAQTGIVSTIAHERPHNGTALELFLPSGPFAILPMKGNRSSIVWTERKDQAPSFLKLDDARFLSEVTQRFGDQFGALSLAGPRWSYPLSMHLAARYVASRFALAGDAAHGVHPIAGQGLNLGLRDAAALAEVVVDAKRLGLDIGSVSVLERYEKWRRFDNALFATAMDVMNGLFSNDYAPLKFARRAGLDIVDGLRPLKGFFMRQASGEGGQVPRLLRGAQV